MAVRRRLLPPDDPRHGTTNGYTNWKCHCDRCRAANTAYYRERRRGEKVPCVCGRLKDPRSETCTVCSHIGAPTEHGTEREYKKGCHCSLCRKAAADGRRARGRGTESLLKSIKRVKTDEIKWRGA